MVLDKCVGITAWLKYQSTNAKIYGYNSRNLRTLSLFLYNIGYGFFSDEILLSNLWGIFQGKHAYLVPSF